MAFNYKISKNTKKNIFKILFSLYLNNIGCGLAIQIEQALCIALTFHYICIIKQFKYRTVIFKIMEKLRVSLIAFACCIMAFFSSYAENIYITTQNTTLVIDATKGSELRYVYFGEKLAPTDLDNIGQAKTMFQMVYPPFGMVCLSETALSAVHSDGNMSTQLAVESVAQKAENNSFITTIRLKDKIYPFYVDINYKTYSDTDIIETWTEITNNENKKVVLTKFASAYLPIRKGDVWLSHFHGSWGAEASLVQEPLIPGVREIRNTDGVRNSQTDHAEVMFSLDGKPQENYGRTIGAALCYTGNYKLRIDTESSDYHHFFVGINEDNSFYDLSERETFVTPVLAFSYSNEGTGGISRNFHKWARNHVLPHGNQERKILLNSWEGVYLHITEAKMKQMMDDIAEIGGELFVMDDGWFGDKHPRNTDKAGLGDWMVNKDKLPNGISDLVDYANRNNLKFGIWIEPEMANTSSELYEKHPDWIIQAQGRDITPGRGGTQVVLDLSNPEVQEHVFRVVDNLMTENPAIDYIKWDANMSVLNFGSNYLPKDRQNRLYIEYHKGLETVLKRIRAKYPDLTIQACASGGGRANYGYLKYFDEFWVSDNTDGLQRIYMQWGASYFYPALTMASHVSAIPNLQTQHMIPLKFRIDVAMSGRFGLELQPQHMTPEEKEMCRQAIADYKQIRHIVQLGDLYRLVSPYDGSGLSSLMYVTENKDEAAFYWWKLQQFVNEHYPRVKMAGLDPERQYRIKELNRTDKSNLPYEGKIYSGRFLMANGLEIPYRHDYKCDYASRILYLEAVN